MRIKSRVYIYRILGRKPTTPRGDERITIPHGNKIGFITNHKLLKSRKTRIYDYRLLGRKPTTLAEE